MRLTLKGASGVTLARMIGCCCPPLESHTSQACPACATPTVPVDLSTVKALLTTAALARLTLQKFRFCASAACEVVYVSDAAQVFRVDDLRVPVWQKLPPGHRIVCYCFGENERDMQREIDEQGQTWAVERVRSHIAKRRCACEVRNPRGACCLGDVIAAAKRLQASQEVNT
jgi:hypothetical protein